nr:uncharacterized protein I203_08123 [Kwoniella mangroviensis CBS 8507]OCF62808.1 hypothetical protein I203_08123 [Kwoniella mangroviensis CBS 8507]
MSMSDLPHSTVNPHVHVHQLALRVITVDYRGAGDSDRPRDGYDKLTMSRDIHTLYKDKLGIDKVILVGSDIGSMVASNLAMQFEHDVEALVTFEAPIPGTQSFDRATTEPSSTWSFLWHFFFHNQADLPELLIQGKENEYIGHFYHRLCYDPSFLLDKNLETCESSPMQEFIETQTKEYSNDVTFKLVPKSMHWIPEENPEGFLDAVSWFLKNKKIL